MKNPCIALLGRKDEPTDGVEEYCRYLGSALHRYGFQLELRRVPWEKHGWHEALHALRLQAGSWQGRWVLVQYTALAWSTRGFPQKFLRVLHILRSAGARIAIVYHDVQPFPGSRVIDRLRLHVQMRTMRQALQRADLAIFTVALDRIPWIGTAPPHAHFISVGPNLPIDERAPSSRPPNAVPAVGVFSITGGNPGAEETETIIRAVRYASEKLGRLRLLVFGRHAELREAALRKGLGNGLVELSIEGVIESAQVVQRLSVCDVLLFIRGAISSRRGSAIAGIACGLPVIAYPGSETAPPITEAGVVLVPREELEQLNTALVRVLSDVRYRDDLAALSRTAYETHFSWNAIAARYASLLHS